MPLRELTGTILGITGGADYAGKPLVFVLNPGGFDLSAIYPEQTKTAILDENSEIPAGFQLWTNAEGFDAHYTCIAPNGDTFDFDLPDGVGSVDLAALRAAGTATPNGSTLALIIDTVDDDFILDAQIIYPATDLTDFADGDTVLEASGKTKSRLEALFPGGGGTQFWANDGTFKTIVAPAWGAISGTLSDQTDLQSEFDSLTTLLDDLDTNKQDTITTGTTSQYFKGDLSLATLNQAAVAGLTTADSPTFAGLEATGITKTGKIQAYNNSNHYLDLTLGDPQLTAGGNQWRFWALNLLFQHMTTNHYIYAPYSGGNIVLLPNNNVGVNTSTPARKLEVLDTNPQIRASYSALVYTDFHTDGSGNLTITPSATGGIKNISFSNRVQFDTGGHGAVRISTNAGTQIIALVASGQSSFGLQGGVVIGSASGNANAILDCISTAKAFLPPRMTTTQKNAIPSPIAGMVVYDSTLDKLCVRGASAWETITSV